MLNFVAFFVKFWEKYYKIDDGKEDRKTKDNLFFVSLIFSFLRKN